MTFECDGLILREKQYGESDILFTILTPHHGKLFAMGKGARSMRCAYRSIAHSFNYNNFVVSERNGLRWIREASSIVSFYHAGVDIASLALMQYFADVTGEIAVEAAEDQSALLKLILNALYALTASERPRGLIKAAFELRAVAEAGFMPDLSGCESCGRAAADQFYLDMINGVLRCDGCYHAIESVQRVPYNTDAAVMSEYRHIGTDTLAAMRYVLSVPQERIYAFVLEGEPMNEFAGVCERYLLCQLERSFDTLDFYHSIADME